MAELGQKATHFDRIAALSHQAFNALAATVPESMSGRKVLAAMIIKRSATDEGTVISLGTGRNFSFIAKIGIEIGILINFTIRRLSATFVDCKLNHDVHSKFNINLASYYIHVWLVVGNRCITGQYLSLEGTTVNDSHAEIITRRGFLR